MNRLFITLILILSVTGFIRPAILGAEIEIQDGLDNTDIITSGTCILTLDYIGLWDNEVSETGTDYPYGRLWLILYDPTPYIKQENMDEEEWIRSDELVRFELDGPSSADRWANGDEIIYSHFGIHDWASNSFDTVVFRVLVEEPDKNSAVDTIIWGIIFEDDTHDTDYEFRTDSISIYFRTTDLPEPYTLPSGTFEDIWIEHGVEVAGFDGITVHTKFQVDDMRASNCRIAGFVHYDTSGDSVACEIDNPDYRTPSGNLTIQRDFIPIYPSTVFSDMTLFIPYDAFPISEEFVDYYVTLEILDNGWEYVISENSPVFSVKKPS